MGYASALAWFLFLIILAFTLVQLGWPSTGSTTRARRRRSEERRWLAVDDRAAPRSGVWRRRAGSRRLDAARRLTATPDLLGVGRPLRDPVPLDGLDLAQAALGARQHPADAGSRAESAWQNYLNALLKPTRYFPLFFLNTLIYALARGRAAALLHAGRLRLRAPPLHGRNVPVHRSCWRR